MYIVFFSLVDSQNTVNSNLSLFLVNKISKKGKVWLVSNSCVNFKIGSIKLSMSVIFPTLSSCR